VELRVASPFSIGNLYHLNAEEEPEDPQYPKNPEFRKRFGPRGVLKSMADGKIQDTGPLTKKRRETVDEEFLAAALDFIDRQHKGLGVWQGEFTPLRAPKVFNLRSDPFERADETVYQLETTKLFFVVPAQAVVAQWLETFKQFPPRQKPASFNIDAVIEKLTAPQGSGK